MMADRSFRELLAKFDATPDAGKARLIDAYLSTMRYPILEDDSTAVLLYRGDRRSVRLTGDMTDWIDTIPFEKVGGTDLWFAPVRCEPDARLEYVLMLDDDPTPVTDPLNRYGVRGFVLNSELAMPRYERREVFAPYLDGREGGLELVREHNLPAGALPYGHTIHVYLPPGYDGSSKRFPAVYFQDGHAYLAAGVTSHALDRLTREGTLPPLIGVFVTPPNTDVPEVPNRMTEYGMNDDYIAFICDELVPWVDGSFRTEATPSCRLVAGASYGGLIAATIALRRPRVFGLAYSQSGYLSFRGDALIKECHSAAELPGRFFADCGTYERRVARGIVPDDEGDFLEANRRFRDMMRGRKADLIYREYPEGHTWGNWRAHLIDALQHFFGPGVRVAGGGGKAKGE
jgi:enterochelin esterase family protein